MSHYKILVLFKLFVKFLIKAGVPADLHSRVDLGIPAVGKVVTWIYNKVPFVDMLKPSDQRRADSTNCCSAISHRH